MPEENSTDLIDFNGWTMRVRRAVQEPARFMLLLHGWTGDENSMWVFARKFPADLWIAAPRAPLVSEHGGFTWRTEHLENWSLPTLSDFKPTAENLIQLVNEYSLSIGVNSEQVEIAGFSQGAVLTNVLTLLYPHRIRKAAILSGFMPAGIDDLIAGRVLENKPFYVAHGKQDNIIPVDQAQLGVKLLEQAGAHVTYCEAEVGHKVSADCLRGLETFLKSS